MLNPKDYQVTLSYGKTKEERAAYKAQKKQLRQNLHDDLFEEFQLESDVFTEALFAMYFDRVDSNSWLQINEDMLAEFENVLKLIDIAKEAYGKQPAEDKQLTMFGRYHE